MRRKSLLAYDPRPGRNIGKDTMTNKTQTIAKPVAKAVATKAAPKAATKPQAKAATKPQAKAAQAPKATQAPAIIATIISWVDALPGNVTFYRNAVNHHKTKGTMFPRVPLLPEAELTKAFEVTRDRIGKSVNANGFSESKRVFDAYIVGKYGVGAIPTK